MQTFTDENGRNWKLRLNVRTVRLVRENCGIDLLNLDKDVAELANDPCKTGDVLYALVNAEAEQAIGEEEFAGLLFGDVLNDATGALMEELISFFPNPSVRQHVRAARDAGMTLIRKSCENATKQLTDILTNTNARNIPPDGNLSGSAPESSESPLGTIPFANCSPCVTGVSSMKPASSPSNPSKT